MRFTIAGLLAFAMAATAIPHPNGGAPPKGDSGDLTQQCGNQIFACCSNIYIGKDKRQLTNAVGEVVGLVGDVVSGLGEILGSTNVNGEDKTCYSHKSGSICADTFACCPGNGAKCAAIHPDSNSKPEKPETNKEY